MHDREWKGTGRHCFSPQTVGPSMLRLSLAAACNMRCIHCSRRSDRSGDPAMPGLSPDDAVEEVAAAVGRNASPDGVLIAGPGEPLVSAQTFVVVKKLSWLYPDIPITIATNGLLLPDRLDELVRSGVRNIVLSLNAASAGTAGRLYEWAIYRGRKYIGEDAARLVLQQQWNGLENSVEAGLSVTVSLAVIAGVNDHEAAVIRQRAEDIGAARVVVDPFP